MARGRRATDSTRKTQENWRPTGSLAKRLARLILATALMSATVGAILSGVSLTLEYRARLRACLLYTSPSPRDGLLSRMPSSA